MSNASDRSPAVFEEEIAPFPADGLSDALRAVPTSDGASSSLISPKRIVWPVLLSLAVLGVIGAFTFHPGEFLSIVSGLNAWMLGLALASVFVRVYLGGWRLDYISKGRLGRAGGIRGQLAWDFFSNVTPSAIGGAPFAAVYIAQDKKINVGESTALMLFTMLLDQLWFALTIPLVLAASMVLEVIPASLGNVGLAGFTLYFIGILAWVVLFGYSTFYRPDILQKVTTGIFRIKWLRRFQDRVDVEMTQLRHRARLLRTQPARFYANGMLLTIGTWAARYLLLLFIVWSFLPDFDKLLLLLRTAAMTLGSLVMPTPGGAGGIEGLYALFIGPLIPAAILVPTLLIWRFLGYYLFVGLGIFLSTHHVQKTIRQNRREARAAQGLAAPMSHDQPAEIAEEVADN
jgi:hypothetical protein